MNPAAFFRTDPVRRVIERASLAASAPVSIHFVEGDQEGPVLAGVGRCDACRYVTEYPGGKAACKASRMLGAAQALQRGTPAPFLCHMAFACVAAPALPRLEQGFVITFGPYCPSEAPETLVEDALKGLQDLGHEPQSFFPVPLSDIAFVSAEAPPAIAEWTGEALAGIWRAAQREEAQTETPTEPNQPTRRRSRRVRGKTPDTSPYRGGEVAAALAAGNQTLARTLVRSALSEVETRGEVLAVRRARTIALVGAALEAAEKAGLDTVETWEEFPAFLTAVRHARTDSELARAAMALLAIILRRTVRAGTDGALAELNRIVMARLPETVQLNDVAKRLGRHPSAITHQLQRKFGLSFTQYVGRLRIDTAKELLRRTRLGIGEVALRVGISDASNFSKLFRKFEGVTPQQYRSRYRSQR